MFTDMHVPAPWACDSTKASDYPPYQLSDKSQIFMFDQEGQMTLLKKDVEISSDAWHERICSKKGNIISGFRTSGI